jgi:hypothetical protein
MSIHQQDMSIHQTVYAWAPLWDASPFFKNKLLVFFVQRLVSVNNSRASLSLFSVRLLLPIPNPKP